MLKSNWYWSISLPFQLCGIFAFFQMYKYISILSFLRIKCTLSSDIWSFGTLLWEVFSKGSPPLPNTPPIDAARQYVSGVRLKWPGGANLKQVENLMINCWSPLPEQRVKPQTIMRDMNQILYRVSDISYSFSNFFRSNSQEAKI